MQQSQFMSTLYLNQGPQGCQLVFKTSAADRLQFQLRQTAKIAATNVIPHSYAPHVESNGQLHQEIDDCQQELVEARFDDTQNAEMANVLIQPVLTSERENLLLNKVNLEGTRDWSEEPRTRTKDLFRDFAHIFALESLEMGHTSLVKHKIKLDNYTPFKERYQRIPPTLFDKVKNHLKAMIQVGAIRCSNSPWTRQFLLERKMNPYIFVLICEG